ncbi:MAG: metal ABC transporter solute-binding protein, Zn/Mn family [Sporomusa sp.]
MYNLKRKISIFVTVGLVLIFALASTLTGCSPAPANTSGKLNVVATTTMIADLSSIIGGDLIEVRGLMGPGIDPHLYQASAGDVTKMQNADIVVYNGLHLEGKMSEVFESLKGQGKTVICLEDGLERARLLEDEDNNQLFDPHIWFDVSLWKDAAKHVTKGFCQADPKNEAVYRENLQAYLLQLEQLDAYIKSRIAELPKNQRVLVTAHDAFRYFGNAYAFEVKGLQGISTDAEAGTADVSNLASFIAQNKIRAIFVESSVPPKNIQALQAAVSAKGFEVQIGGELYSDSLGDASSGHNTYILTFKANIDTIVNALRLGAKT